MVQWFRYFTVFRKANALGLLDAECDDYSQYGLGFPPLKSLDPHSINSLAFDLDFRVVCLRN
jgi:hypothetical protein